MTIERPMLPPRAESMDSVCHQPAIKQRPEERPTGNSPKPSERLSRRNMLGVLAVLPAGLPAAASTANPPDGHKVPDGTDVAFALIAAKLAADVAHGAAIDVETEAETRYGRGSEQAREVAELTSAACDVVNKADWTLATTAPTTLAGVAAVLRFANQIEDDGLEWPDTDMVGAEGWHYALRSTMAEAIETILEEGGAYV